MERLPRHFVRRERYTRYRKNFEIETSNIPSDGKDVVKITYENNELHKSTESLRENYQRTWTLNKRVNGSVRQDKRNIRDDGDDKKCRLTSKTNLDLSQNEPNFKTNPILTLSQTSKNSESNLSIDTEDLENEDMEIDSSISMKNPQMHNKIDDYKSTSSKKTENQADIEVIMNNEQQVLSKSNDSSSIQSSLQHETEKVPFGINQEVEETLSINNENGINNKRALKKPRKWCGTVRNRRNNSNNSNNNNNRQNMQNYQQYNNISFYQDIRNIREFKECDEYQTSEEQSKIGTSVESIQTEVSTQDVQIPFELIERHSFESNLIGSFSDTMLVLSHRSKPILESMQSAFDICKMGTINTSLLRSLKPPPNEPQPKINCYLVNKNGVNVKVSQNQKAKIYETKKANALKSSVSLANIIEPVLPLIIKEIVNSKIPNGSKLQDSESLKSNNSNNDFEHSTPSMAIMPTNIFVASNPKSQRSQVRPRREIPRNLGVKDFSKDALVVSCEISPVQFNPRYRRDLPPQVLASNSNSNSNSESQSLSSSHSATTFAMDENATKDLISFILDKINNRVIKQLIICFLYAAYFIHKHGRRLLYFIVLPLFYFGIFFLAYCSCQTVCEKSTENIQEIPL